MILYADMLHSYDAQTDASQSCHFCCLALTVSWEPAYLSSAAHLEPVFMYKGEVYGKDYGRKIYRGIHVSTKTASVKFEIF